MTRRHNTGPKRHPSPMLASLEDALTSGTIITTQKEAMRRQGQHRQLPPDGSRIRIGRNCFWGPSPLRREGFPSRPCLRCEATP